MTPTGPQTHSTPASGSPHLLAALRGLAPHLPPSKRRVAAAIQADPAAVAHLTIGELAAQADTSPTTVIRLCRELGVGSYRDLRVALASESGLSAGRLGGQVGSDIRQSDSLHDVVRTITHADASAVLETADLLDENALSDAVSAVVAAGRIDVFGVGASAVVSLDLHQKLHRIGLTCFRWADQHSALTATALAQPGDVVIGVSHTGETRDTVEVMQRAQRAHAVTIGITASPRSHLARVADHCLLTASRETTFRSGAMASRLAALTVVDILFVGVAQRRYGQALGALDATRDAVQLRRFDKITEV